MAGPVLSCSDPHTGLCFGWVFLPTASLALNQRLLGSQALSLAVKHWKVLRFPPLRPPIPHSFLGNFLGWGGGFQLAAHNSPPLLWVSIYKYLHVRKTLLASHRARQENSHTISH